MVICVVKVKGKRYPSLECPQTSLRFYFKLPYNDRLNYTVSKITCMIVANLKLI